jgi:hypothetical protein
MVGAVGQGGPDSSANAQFKDAFDRLSRGDVSIETISKLLNLDDREFWKGAIVGAAAALLVSNLPAVKGIFEAMTSPKAADDPDESD